MIDTSGPSRLLGPGLPLGEVTVGLLIALLLSFGSGIGVGFLMGSGVDRPPTRRRRPDGYRRQASVHLRRPERPDPARPRSGRS